MNSTRIGMAAFALLIGTSLVGCSDQEAPGTSEQAADTQASQASQASADIATYGSLGSFSAMTLDGDTFTDADVAAKDVTVINCWQTTCPPCIEETSSKFGTAWPPASRISVATSAAGPSEGRVPSTLTP